MPVAIVQLFEPEGGQKVLRVTVPLGMQLAHGTRLLIDQGPAHAVALQHLLSGRLHGRLSGRPMT